jgi:hypothetical protein
MLHYPFWSPRKTRPMLKLKLTKPPGSLSASNTSTNRFMIFYRSPMPSTSSAMISTRCHTSFRWETNFGCTCRKNALQGPIRSFFHSVMDLTPSPRSWVTILLSSTFSLPWLALIVQCGSPSIIFSTIIGHLRDRRTIDTNKTQP